MATNVPEMCNFELSQPFSNLNFVDGRIVLQLTGILEFNDLNSDEV